MKLANSRERLQVIFALVGFLLACLSAALIVVHAVHQSSTTIVFQSIETQHERDVNDMEDFLIDKDPTYMVLRNSHRRRLIESSATINPTATPSASPTVIVSEIYPFVPQDNKNDSSSSFSDSTIPAVMIGASSCIIVLALLLYGHDVRDRFQDNKVPSTAVLPVDKPDDEILEEGDTSAGSSSGYWINTTSNAVAKYPMLPPMTPESGHEDLSISRVSTLTGTSLIDSHGPWSGVVEDKLKCIDSSSQVTELSDDHLVPQDSCGISTLMKKRTDAQSECSSLLSIADDDYDDEEQGLFGEVLRDDSSDEEEESLDFEQLDDSPYPSFEYTPDKEDHRESMSEGSEEAVHHRINTFQLEDFIADIEFDKMYQTPSVVREIFFSPGSGDCGLQFDKRGSHDYPTVLNVDPTSPLWGRLHIGDSILSVNEVNGMEFNAADMKVVLESAIMVKLVVASANASLDNDSDSASSLDLTELEDPMEV